MLKLAFRMELHIPGRHGRSAIELSLTWTGLEMDAPSPGDTWSMEVTMDDRDNGVCIPVEWYIIEALHINEPEYWGDAVFHM